MADRTRLQRGRRTVTTVFAGSTDLADRLDPEALSRVVERYFDA